MATINDAYSPYAVVPKLPTFKQPYTPQQNIDPSAYYTKALGFLPIDTRYMVNTTNTLAYNSMADVLFNKAAQDKRWKDHWYMQGILNPLRIVADTILLTKDTVVDPMVQGAIEDGWSGFTRGSSTALMNSLVGIGNTLDIISNPVKGLILEGGEGFVKGLIGDADGRKQYDYNEYIHTGDGVADFLFSLAAEIVSDPLNWISFGGKAAVKAGADTVADTAVKSVKSALKEALEKGIKNVDDLVPELMKKASYLSEDTTRSLLKQVAGNSDTITRASLSQLDELQPLLKKAITVAETTDDYGKLATKYAQGKATRFKITQATPTSQMFVSDYLKAASTTMPDLLGSSMNNAIKYGAKTYKGVQQFEKILRQVGGLTGLTPAVYLTKQGARAAGWLRNINALHDPNVIKTIDDLKKSLDIGVVEKASVALEKTVDPTTTKEFIAKLYTIKNSFNAVLNQSPFSKSSVNKITKIQKDFITKADALVKELGIENITTYTDYIKYLENANAVLKNSDVDSLISELQTIKNILSEDFSDDVVRLHYKKSIDAAKFDTVRTQGQQMKKASKMLRDFQRKYNPDAVVEIEKAANDTDDAIKLLTTVNKETGLDVLTELDRNIIPHTLDTLVAAKAHNDIIKSFEDLVKEFRESLSDFTNNSSDIITKSDLVENYKTLYKRLKSFTEFNMSEGNISDASELYNMLGEAKLERHSYNTRGSYKLNDYETKLIAEAERLEKEIINNTDAAALRRTLKENPELIPEELIKKHTHKLGGFDESAAIEEYVNTHINEKLYDKINELFKEDFTVTQLINKARELRILTTQSPVTVFSKKTLSQAIRSLSEISAKTIRNVIDPADVSKYKLVIYSVMNRSAGFINRMLGIAPNGTVAERILESIIVAPKILEESFTNTHIGDFLSYIEDVLPKAYNSAVNVGATKASDDFVAAVRTFAEDFIGRKAIHSDRGEWFDGYFWTDLDSFAKNNPVLKEAWDAYKADLAAVLEAGNRSTDSVLSIDLKNSTAHLRTVLKEQAGKLPPVTEVSSDYANLLLLQAENILKMSDDDIAALATYKTKEIYNYPEAHLSKLLTIYEDRTSDLYKFLNNPDNAADNVFGSTVYAAKNLIERLQAYKKLVTEVSNLATENGLEGFYIEGLLDALMTQLSRRTDITDFNIDKVVTEMMSGTHLYVRNLFDTPSTSMDSVLSQVVNKLSKKPNLDPQAKVFIDNIREKLEAGLAHGAVADVDNLTDLIQLSKYSGDIRLKNLLDNLTHTAKGKRRVVFDIESTGANEAAAHVFQIAGKVLDENGNVIKGSEFNFIIKPPTGIKPTPNVLKTLAPKGVDPTEWWNNSIVNAEAIEGVQDVFENIEDALNAFVKHCTDHGEVVLVGHNIKAYDLPTLIKRSPKTKAFLKKVDTFDTLEHMNSNVMFQLTGDQEKAFKAQLKNIFIKAIEEDNPALQIKPFQYADIRTLSDLKRYLQEANTDSRFSIAEQAERDSKKLIEQGVDYTERQSLSNIKYSGSAGEFEDIIDSVVESWSSPAKVQGNKFFVVSKLNPDSLIKEVQDYLKELAQSGWYKEFEGVAPGKNIMQYFSANVFKESVLINPVRAISYEVEDIFDLQKALEVYKVVNKENVLRFQDMAKLTKQALAIQRIRNWIPEYYIKEVVDDARAFLKEAEQYQNFVKVLYDDADDITIVAAAIYAYRQLGDSNVLKQSDAYKHFGDVSNKVSEARKRYVEGIDEQILIGRNKQYTPILHNIDDATGMPRAVFTEDWHTFDELVSVLKKDMALDDVRAFNTSQNLFNVHSAAKHALLEPVSRLAKEVEDYLKGLGTGRIEAEQALRHYFDALDQAAITDFLNRANRVSAFKNEAFVRGGFVCFETNYKLDLSDFKADAGLVVKDNVLNTNGKYVHIICATRETFNVAKDFDVAAITVKNVDGIDDKLISFIERSRNYSADVVVKNLGYSHGDVITKEAVENIHNTLERLGVSKDIINTLPNVDDLSTVLKERPAFFNTSRANLSVIGNKGLWSFITNDSDVFQTTDPFKQLVHSIYNANAERTTLIHYCNLLLNEYSELKANAGIFAELSSKDVYKLLKENDDFCLVYITTTGYWNKTKSGLIVKEFDLVNAASIERARKMGGVHIMPRTQAAQLMQAVNEFDLPPIAKFAKGISDVYKVAYLGSLGFIIRNVIDSNYKTYASLDRQVSLGKSVSHFVESLGIVRRHTSIGQEYTKVMGRYFSSDLEYEVFYKYCNGAKDIVSDYPEKLQKRIIKQLEELSKKFNAASIAEVKSKLIQPELFSIVDAFINHGPSAGLSKTILDNIPSASKEFDDIGLSTGFNNWITRHTPMKYVYGANDYIEQAARLSMFLQRLELGDTIDDANKAIIKAHFDYSDKTIGQLYTEILFPFMTFSYKNLNFWIDMMYSNPALVGQMENIFRPILDYQGLFEPDQGAYQSYDYTFDWSKNVTSFEANAPWTMINAARLYHILNGNILIKHGDTVMHDAGYGAKENELYTVFKLSPSVLDATKMLFNPLNIYSERLLPPYETAVNIFKSMANGEDVVEKMNVASLANMLPYFDTVMQRLGIDEKGLRHNNIWKRIEDAGSHQILGSLFGTAYVPIKDNYYWYDSDYNILGGFKTNYYAKRNYSNPYNSKYPSYTLTRMAQNKKPRNIYAKSKINSIYNQQYNSLIRGISYRSLEYRLRDYHHYY